MSTLPNDPPGSIPVDIASQWTANWREFIASSNQAFNILAFTIPIECIKNMLLYNENAEGIRAYIALENADEVSSAKLVMVPVIGNEDIINQPADNSKSNVYDNTDACPPVCALNSPLN
ncbi:hypothetical protein EOD41_14420 [Mucilaginibacter limnophilus]|uniref:Uncharacterized protein n=1 Tax=Mucilaginibacter limnophilus TaxID=1932778 RepID=A0A437MR69_9SPHI|nr:hypothetical protein [Mucilaginibacter limnophilus]RVU00151.1 hypothetical protein EOD41_14420 [Mucilaginibacter limnophilus]